MKTITSFLFALLFTTTLFSQKVSIGPEIGMNLVRVGASNVDPNYSVGLNQGFKIQYKLNDKLSLSSGIYIDQRFQRYETSNTILLNEYSPLLAATLGDVNLDVPGLSFDVLQTEKAKLSNFYTRVPLMLNIHKEKMHFSIGGYYSYLVSSRTNITTTSRVPLLETLDLAELLGGGQVGDIAAALLPPAVSEEETSFTSTDGLNTSDYGLQLGIGYTEEKVGFNVNYTYGFVDYRVGGGSEFENNSAVTVSFSYLIDIRQKSK